MSRPQRRPLGKSGLEIAPLALGGNVFGWTVDEPTGFRILDRFVDAGFNLIDTADVYSIWVDGHHGGESETILGKWLRASGRREEVVLATKVGMDMRSEGKGLSAGHIERSVVRSLERLQTDRIDLYQAHEDDAGTRLDETLGAFAKLVEAGRVRALGASNYDADRLEAALRVSAEHGWPRYECLQPRYNLLDRQPYEDRLAPVCRAHDLGVIAYSSLASGFLTGKYRSKADLGKSPRGPRMEQRLDARGHRILAALDEVSARLDSPPSAIALAWLMARPGLTAPIASATSVRQLDELLGAVDVHLDAEATRSLERASA